jgi:succinyl-diaminopimelate desuccinylase
MPTTTNTITENLTELLSHLIRFPTVTADHATTRAAIDWVEDQLSGLPLHIERYTSNRYPSLVATTRNTKKPKLWLAAHIDVVPGKPADFKPVVRNRQLHGRGAHDMKSALALFIALLKDLGDDLPQYDLGLMVTADEEVGGYHGVKWLIEEHGYRGQLALMPDSGGSWEMEMGSKGIMWWELTATGKAAHASRTWEGSNAIDKIVAFVSHIRTHLPTEPCSDNSHQHATVNFATIQAGEATNQVPDSATTRLDIRFPPNLTLEDIQSWFDEAATAVPGVHAKPVLADPPYEVKHNGPVTAFRQLIREVTGHDVTLTTAHGSSDARHFARHNISTINVCSTGSGFHVPDEWIDLADLTRFYEIVRRFVDTWGK